MIIPFQQTYVNFKHLEISQHLSSLRFLSVLVGILFALILPTLPGSALAWSIIAGPVLWALVQFVVLPLVNPVMSEFVHPVSFVTVHLLYSLVLGLWVTRHHKVPVQ